MTLVACLTLLGIALMGCSFDASARADLGPEDDPEVDGGARGSATDPPRATTEPGEGDAAPTSPESGLGVIVSDWVPEGPDVDGLLDDLWQERLIGYSMPEAMEHAQIHPAYSYDGSVQFASVHTDDQIFFVFEVHDNLTVSDFIAPAEEDDAIFLYLDGKGDRDGPYRDDDHRFRLSSAGTYATYGAARRPLDAYALEIIVDGYRIELSAPLDLFETEDVGIDFALSDNDLLGSLKSDAIGVWYVADRPRCEDCCSGGGAPFCDTTYFGSLLIMPE